MRSPLQNKAEVELMEFYYDLKSLSLSALVALMHLIVYIVTVLASSTAVLISTRNGFADDEIIFPNKQTVSAVSNVWIPLALQDSHFK